MNGRRGEKRRGRRREVRRRQQPFCCLLWPTDVTNRHLTAAFLLWSTDIQGQALRDPFTFQVHISNLPHSCHAIWHCHAMTRHDMTVSLHLSMTWWHCVGIHPCLQKKTSHAYTARKNTKKIYYKWYESFCKTKSLELIWTIQVMVKRHCSVENHSATSVYGHPSMLHQAWNGRWPSRKSCSVSDEPTPARRIVCQTRWSIESFAHIGY